MEKVKRSRKKPAYLTKRILVSSARTAGVKASRDAMKLMGHVVVSHGGYVVRKYSDGRMERIAPIASTTNLKLILD